MKKRNKKENLGNNSISQVPLLSEKYLHHIWNLSTNMPSVKHEILMPQSSAPSRVDLTCGHYLLTF